MTEVPKIVAIVEGDGEQHAVPGLLRRILTERLCKFDISISQPVVTKGKPNMLKQFDKFLRYAIQRPCDAILLLLDADDECPKEKYVHLSKNAAALNLKIPVAIVYAKCEYETWFICSLSQDKGQKIRDRLRILETITAPDNVENIRGAKEWLGQFMPSDRGYTATSDQTALTYHMDLDLVYSRSRSFRRLCHAVEELVQAINSRTSSVTP